MNKRPEEMARNRNKGSESLMVTPGPSRREESHRVSGKDLVKMKVNDSLAC